VVKVIEGGDIVEGRLKMLTRFAALARLRRQQKMRPNAMAATTAMAPTVIPAMAPPERSEDPPGAAVAVAWWVGVAVVIGGRLVKVGKATPVQRS
jgi:hypothetical protein